MLIMRGDARAAGRHDGLNPAIAAPIVPQSVKSV
jgi:hypothetical protein